MPNARVFVRGLTVEARSAADGWFEVAVPAGERLVVEQTSPIPVMLQAADGCGDDDVIEEGWPIVRHFVTAQLRWAFGIDSEPVGMSQEIEAEFPEATFQYDESL